MCKRTLHCWEHACSAPSKGTAHGDISFLWFSAEGFGLSEDRVAGFYHMHPDGNPVRVFSGWQRYADATSNQLLHLAHQVDLIWRCLARVWCCGLSMRGSASFPEKGQNGGDMCAAFVYAPQDTAGTLTESSVQILWGRRSGIPARAQGL